MTKLSKVCAGLWHVMTILIIRAMVMDDASSSCAWSIIAEQNKVEEAMSVYSADLGLDDTLVRPSQHAGNIWSLLDMSNAANAW